MLKKLGFIFIILLLASSLFGGDLSVQKAIGDVQVKLPGGQWQPAKVGMVLPVASSISTGKGAFAIVGYDKVVINVMPVSRVTVEELLETNDTHKTTLNMQSGKLGAAVKTQGKKNDFTVKTPISTASVRGTEIVFDGYVIEVISGVVDFANSYNIKVAVTAGTKVQTSTATPVPELPAEVMASETEVSVTPATNIEVPVPDLTETPDPEIAETTSFNLNLR